MATLNFIAQPDSWLEFHNISSTLSDLQNGAGTLAVLTRDNAHKTTAAELCALRSAGVASGNMTTTGNWYHGLQISTSDLLSDDDGAAIRSATTGTVPFGTTANDFFIAALGWPASASAATERFHVGPTTGGVGSWVHSDSTTQTIANRAGPGTGGYFTIGYTGDGSYVGDIAVVAAWVGQQLTDTQVQDLFANKKTSDWWNNSAGHPTLLVECTSLTPTDIGAAPSSYFATGAEVALTGLNPTGWTFDGTGASVPNLRIVSSPLRW